MMQVSVCSSPTVVSFDWLVVFLFIDGIFVVSLKNIRIASIK